ncbi:MAG: ABC transporter ATP-binding protein, partial [Candidatus Cellulosilyticum pullistercoris]|nr:ABC transporter ATP-binding protein [Candidatus Cellulosilyticum pullistercoris]
MKHTLGRLMGYLGKHKLGLVLVIIFIIINSVAMVGSVAFLSPIINNYILPGDFSGLARELTLLGSIFLLGSVSSYVYARIMVHIAQKSIHEIRSDLFNKMQKLSIKYFDSHTHGDLMSLYTNDIESISEALNNSVTNVIASSLSFIGVIVMMIVINPILTLITLSILGVMILLMKKIGKQSGRYFGMQQMRMANLNGYIEEMIEGQKVVKVFCHEEKAIEQFEKLNEELREASTGAQTFAGSMMPLMGNVSHINFAINCCLGAVFTIAGILNLGTLIAYLQYVRQVSQPVTQVSQQMNVIIAALAGAERIFKVLDEEPEVDNGTVTLAKVTVKEDGRLEEADHYTGHWAWNKNGELVELKGDVKFDNVVFGYNEEKTIL